MKECHPSDTDLALLAGGDCGRWQTFRLNRHVARCGDCQDALASFTDLRSKLADYVGTGFASDVPDWDRLAGEMRANIRVGLAAGECVREMPAKSSAWAFKPQWALGMAGVLLLAGAGVFLHGLLPHDNMAGVMPAAELRSTRAGVQLTTGTGSMTLLNRGVEAGNQTVTSDGAIRASDVDAGTVTVTSVYVE